MSYADAAKMGPPQSDAEKVPNPIPEIVHEDSGVHSLDSLHSVNSHVQSIPSDIAYADQQLAAEHAAEARAEDERAADAMSGDAPSNPHSSSRKTESRFEQAKYHAKEAAGQASHALDANASKVKKKAEKAEEWTGNNKNNPVVVGNAVAITALGALLATGAYRMHQANKLTWNVVGIWAGAVGFFAVGDYYVSNYFLQKYRPKN